MSTCLSCPLFSFLTLMLQAARRIGSAKQMVRVNKRLVLAITCPSPGDLRGTFESGPTLSDVGNRDRESSANRNFPKQRLDGCDLGDCRVGKCAYVVLDSWEVAGQVRIAHGDHRRLRPSPNEHLLQKRSGRIRH